MPRIIIGKMFYPYAWHIISSQCVVARVSYLTLLLLAGHCGPLLLGWKRGINGIWSKSPPQPFFLSTGEYVPAFYLTPLFPPLTKDRDCILAPCPQSTFTINSTGMYWALFHVSCCYINQPTNTSWRKIILFAHGSLIWCGLRWEFLLLVLPLVSLAAAFIW